MAEIDGYTDRIDQGMVTARIEELESSQGFKVIRVRTGETLFSCETKNEARKFISDEDYLDSAVEIDELELDSDDEAELRDLRDLDERCIGEVDDWESGMTLVRESQFDGDFVKSDLYDTGDIPRGVDFGSFPFDQIDFDDLVDDYLERNYESIDFDGSTYWYR